MDILTQCTNMTVMVNWVIVSISLLPSIYWNCISVPLIILLCSISWYEQSVCSCLVDVGLGHFMYFG